MGAYDKRLNQGACQIFVGSGADKSSLDNAAGSGDGDCLETFETERSGHEDCHIGEKRECGLLSSYRFLLKVRGDEEKTVYFPAFHPVDRLMIAFEIRVNVNEWRCVERTGYLA